jgi:LytS/YehU family sensor histidine kinase
VKNSGLVHADGGAENSHAQGIGLANTVERLRTLYDSNHSFTVQWLAEGGCEVRIEIPCQRIALSETAVCAC